MALGGDPARAGALARRDRHRAQRLFEGYEELAHQQIAAGNEGPFLRYNLAAIEAIWGEQDAAIYWLREAVALGRNDYLFLSRDPLFENLRGTAAFEHIVAANWIEIDRQRDRVVREGW